MSYSLPPIKQMYESTRQNLDYNVIRKYQNLNKTTPMKRAITKKGHYIDDQIKRSSSPGPANKANIQKQWANKNAHQPKYSDRRTYIDDVQRISKKANSPSPDRYTVDMGWPKKQNKIKLICQKTNFVDHSQYESDKTPGPGAYCVATRIAQPVKQSKFTPHNPLKPRQNTKADMNTYNPCPSSYNTFMKYSMMPKQKGAQKKQGKQNNQKSVKKLNVPGPGHYQVINTWRGKQALKKNQLSYLNSLSKGPASSVYYH